MFHKLLYHEFKATGRIMLPLYGLLMVFTVIMRLFYFNNQQVSTLESSPIANILMGILAFLYIFLLATVTIITLALLLQRFRKNLLGDEGYLMHTLPLPTWQHLTCKLLVSLCWLLISCLLAMVSLFLIAANFQNMEQLWQLIQLVTSNMEQQHWILAVEFFGLLLVSLTEFILTIYASLAIGFAAPKRKGLCSLGVFLVFLILSMLISALLFPNGDPLTLTMKSGTFAFADLYELQMAVLWSICYSLIYSILFFGLSNLFLSKKLNLE
jgi:hypothetical protein